MPLKKYYDKYKEKKPKKPKERKYIDRKKWLEMYPEDKPIDDENMQARARGYDDMAFRQLMAAIGVRAVADYKLASLGKSVDKVPSEAVMEECHAYFMDDYFQFFVNRIKVEKIEEIIKNTDAKDLAVDLRSLGRSQKIQGLL